VEVGRGSGVEVRVGGIAVCVAVGKGVADIKVSGNTGVSEGLKQLTIDNDSSIHKRSLDIA
jgi:hypothetical protein